MTRREKLQASMTDNQLWDYICEANVNCGKCPILGICKNVSLQSEEQFKAWLDVEVEE